jgi:hypothetical protein
MLHALPRNADCGACCCGVSLQGPEAGANGPYLCISGAAAGGKMSLVNVTKVQVLDNPTAFTNPFTFEITFECLSALEEGASPVRE